MPTSPKIPSWLWPALVASLALSVACGAYRWRAEARSKAVGILVEGAAVEDLAQGAASGRELVLKRLCEAGATGVVLAEQTLGELIDAGRLRLEGRTLAASDEPTARQLHFAIEARFGRASVPQDGRRALARYQVPDGVDLAFVRGLPAGLSPEQCEAATRAGLAIAARLFNEPGAGPSYFRSAIARAAELGARAIVPIGEQAPGQRDLLKDVADQMSVMGLAYAPPEFAKIAGDAQLAARMPDRLLRLHTVQSAEIDKMGRPEVVERFVRAYRERNIRLLMLRPVAGASGDPVGDLDALVREVKTGVEREGGTVAWPTPIADPGIPPALFAVLALAVGLVVVAIGAGMVPMGPWRWAGIVLVAVVAAAAVAGLGRQYLATLAAFAFPLGGYLLIESRERVSPWREFALMCLFSLAGGLAVAGLLSELPYMVRVDQFFAVKLAHFGPILVAAAWMGARRIDLAALWRTPVLWGVALLLLAVLAALAFMVARTGNDNPAAVSGLELRLRALLDAVLYVRPRTKEFLVGHPAALVGLFLLARSRDSGDRRSEGWAVGLLTLGAIGQTSIVNTLCHLHSPLDLNLIRIATGIVLGGILGLTLWKLSPLRLAPSPR